MSNPGDMKEMSGRFYNLLGTTLRKEKTVEEQARVLPSQRTIDYGSKWVRFIPDRRGCTTLRHDCRHWHWGRVLTLREYAVGRLAADDSPEEIEDNVERLHMRHLRGWRLSLVHCDASGLSYLESVPVASVWPVKALEYDMAEVDEFNGAHLRGQQWFRSMARRYKAETVREWQAAGLAPGEPMFVQVHEGDK